MQRRPSLNPVWATGGHQPRSEVVSVQSIFCRHVALLLGDRLIHCCNVVRLHRSSRGVPRHGSCAKRIMARACSRDLMTQRKLLSSGGTRLRKSPFSRVLNAFRTPLYNIISCALCEIWENTAYLAHRLYKASTSRCSPESFTVLGMGPLRPVKSSGALCQINGVTRLIRFLAKDGKTYYGDAILPHGTSDIGKVTKAKIIRGSPWSRYDVTDQIAVRLGSVPTVDAHSIGRATAAVSACERRCRHGQMSRLEL
ncbi:hypothetical protein MRB53_039890 [Persea americana]|nr:hypothetical protein MRB53_039890 [Persea americana]